MATMREIEIRGTGSGKLHFMQVYADFHETRNYLKDIRVFMFSHSGYEREVDFYKMSKNNQKMIYDRVVEVDDCEI